MDKKEKDKKIDDYYNEEKEVFHFLDWWAPPISKEDLFETLNDDYLVEKIIDFQEW
ncbi:hypothetical protein [Miniphocaeibacter massiliensis]|uniref:hypothetical protein n=1 Tax=Miniphocaeibacter massiliensis TaxID=2041841 RepID=UPI0013ED04C9|nr:hypothetical protein [Miniphocaeibacter massiliensis]